MTSASTSQDADVPWPAGGVLRVHFDPSALPHLGDEPGVNRFDDPRPRTVDRFLMRYAATTLRGCLLELLASFRDNAHAEERIAAIDDDDPDLMPEPAVAEWQHIADFLQERKVATITADALTAVSINDPALQHELDREPGVRAILDSDAAREALLERGGSRVHLDNAAIRLSSETGRYITQASALALYDRDPKPNAIHYSSRHDDREDCWAIYHHTDVEIGPAEALSPDVPEHADALNSVAILWSLPVPPAWRASDVTDDVLPPSARYDWFGWSIDAAPVETAAGRLAETHEHFHRQLDDTTAFGGLMTTVAAMADSVRSSEWIERRDRLKSMCDIVHESFAVGMSLLTTQRPVQVVPGYPAYDRYVHIVIRLLGPGVHPWVALAALRAAATACMQSGALTIAAGVEIERFSPSDLPRMERPNHRLPVLLAGGFKERVAAANRSAETEHGGASWWQPTDGVLLAPAAMDGAAGTASEVLHRELLDHAENLIAAAGGTSTDPETHYAALRELLSQAQALAPEGLARIGALVESPGGELMHGGALDSQTIQLTAAPSRAVVLPHGSASGLSGANDSAHAFIVLTRPDRILRAFALVEGIELPSTPSVALLRSTVYDGERRDCVLHVVLDDPTQVDLKAPVYLSVLSSAVASDPDTAAMWMRWADPGRLSLVMDTPSSAALKRWCANGGRFRTQTRLVVVEGMEVRIIAGRIEEGERRSSLVIIPTTEFGARWFEAARLEDPQLAAAVLEDDRFFEQEQHHLDIVLNHLLYEERFIGTGSWRR